MVCCTVVVAVFPSTVGVHCEVTVFDITVTVQEECCPFGGILCLTWTKTVYVCLCVCCAYMFVCALV